jgi:parallel beta-helix repeat protein
MYLGGRSPAWLLAGGAVALLGVGWTAADANTLCVNKGGTGHCFKTITAAVAAGVAGDTIDVAAGTYVEGNIKITYSLSVIGAGYKTTIINAAGKANGIYIDGLDAKTPLSEVIVAGFTVEKANFEGILVTNASAVTIAGNEVTDNDLKLDPKTPACPGQPAFETSESDDCGEGIHLTGVSLSTVSGNIVVNNSGGILLSDDTGSTHNNLVSANSVDNNVYDCGITLASHPLYSKLPSMTARGVDANTITLNDSSGNGVAVKGAGAGVGLFVAPTGLETAHNVVLGNNLTKNGLPGVAFHLHTTTPGQNLDSNLVAGNIINGNGRDTEDAATPGTTGINVFAAQPIFGTVIAENVISDEQVDIVANGAPIDAHLNNLLGSGIGVDNLGNGKVNATLNYWGCPTGPNTTGCTTVASKNVKQLLFTPWLTTAVPGIKLPQ